jgi:hypothetical protein
VGMVGITGYATEAYDAPAAATGRLHRTLGPACSQACAFA